MKINAALTRFLRGKIFTLFVLLAILVAFFGITTKGMLFIPMNLKVILNAMVLASFVVTGVGLLLIFGGIDLSTGAVGSLAAVIISTLIVKAGWAWWTAFLAGMTAGAFVGFVNAVFINEMDFQPFIATLGMTQVATGVMYIVGKGTPVSITNNTVINWIGRYELFGVIPFNNLLALICLLGYGFMLAKTEFGRKIYLCGGNRNAARLTGINPKRISYFLFINCGALSAFAAFVLTCRLGGTTMQGMTSFQFTAITAALLGGVTFGGGGGSIFGCFLGIMIINVFQNGLTLLSVNVHIQTIFNGMILVLALAVDIINARRQRLAVLRDAAKTS
jgi:ribose/xylose/arabinose/galactoside ABC-type transport system permease subunit